MDGDQALKNVSGLGYYSTSINWPPAGTGTADGAYLTLPAIHHAARVYVNGRRFLQLTLPHRGWTWVLNLKKGSNEISVVVPTTMWNYIRSIGSDLESADVPLQVLMSAVGYSILPPVTENGLVGTVTLVPHVNVRLE